MLAYQMQIVAHSSPRACVGARENQMRLTIEIDADVFQTGSMVVVLSEDDRRDAERDEGEKTTRIESSLPMHSFECDA